MIRHPKLLALSREHHGALKLGRDAKLAALSGDAAQIEWLSTRVAHLFATELEPHFALEESDLLPALKASGENALVARTVADHADLRALAARLRTPDATTLLHFAERLIAHVRFEERELFEAIQSSWNGGTDAKKKPSM